MPVSDRVEETGRVEIAGPGRVDDRADALGCYHMSLPAGCDDRTLLAAGEAGELGAAAHLGERFIKAADLIERKDLSLVREQDIDMLVDERAEIGAMTLDTERIGQRKRH